MLDGGSMVDFEVDRVGLVWMRNVHGNMPKIESNRVSNGLFNIVLFVL